MHAGSSRRRIEVRDGTVHVYTTVRPIEGKANKDAARLISKCLGLSAGTIRLHRGATSKNKVFLIDRRDFERRKYGKDEDGLLIPFMREV